MLTSILAALLIPVLDAAFSGLAPNIRSILAIVVVLVLIGVVYGLSVLLYDLLLKRAQKLEQKKREEEDPNFERKPVIAFVVLGLICAGIFAYQLLVSTDQNTNIPSLIGEKAVYGLILWSVFNHYFGKHLNQHTKPFSFVLVLLSMLGSSYWGAGFRAQLEAESLARIEGNILSLLEREEDGRMAPIETDESAASGELAILEATLNEYLNQVIANSNAYLTELEAIGYDTLLDGDRIRRDTDLDESQFILARAEVIVDKYEELNVQTAYDFRDNVAEQAISEESKESFRASFDESLAPSIERASQIWDLERQTLAKVDELLRFLAMSQSSWTTESDQYVFETDKNVEIFNKILGEINTMTEEQEALRALSANNTRDIFNGVNN